MAVPQLQTMQIVLHSTGFAVVELARPGKSNALIDAAWPEFVQVCQTHPLWIKLISHHTVGDA